MKIHGIAYILIGAVVTLFSWYTNTRTETNSLGVFMFIGILFVTIGIIKLLFQLVTKQKKEHKVNHPHTHHHNTVHHKSIPTSGKHQSHAQQHTQSQSNFPSHHHPQQSQQHKTFPHYKVCPSCHGHNQHHAAFCMRCGQQL